VTTLSDPSLTPSLVSPALSINLARRSIRAAACGVVLVCADAAAMLLTTFAVLAAVATIAPHWLTPAIRTATWLQLGVLMSAIALYLAMKGRYTTRTPFWSETRHIASATIWAVAAAAAFAALDDKPAESAPTIAVLVVLPAILVAANALAKQALTRIGLWTIRVAVIGDGPHAELAETALGSDRSLGYCFVGRVDPGALPAASFGNRMQHVLTEFDAGLLVIAVEGERQRALIQSALREHVPFALAPPPHTFPAFICELNTLLSHDIMLVSSRHGLARPVARIVKAAIDMTAAALLILLCLPVLVTLYLVCRLDGGPAFFAHPRIGAKGRQFKCLKFRTMVVDADAALQRALAADPALAAQWELTRKLPVDPRVTRIGRFLRKTSLDELPQLFNVLRLEMSLVGPRPIVQAEVPFYGEHIAEYYATRPGMTGMWQVSGRSATSYARRVQLDVWYVNNWSIWHDFAVLLKTIPVVFGRHGAC
jgi:Undecaprenyl-phosphate galactose phosphotransferase WbaP